MRFLRPLVFISLATLAGCVSGPTPQTPAQFRALVVRHSFATMHETYRVRGSYRTVAARIRRRAAECFDETVTSETCSTGLFSHCDDTNYILHPHFRRIRGGSELYVQETSNKMISLGAKPPKSGMFISVADITPARHGGTKIAVYSLTAAWMKYIPKAVKHWADDSNLGCPDFTRGM